MDKRDKFEEKIKAKLEETSGNDADQAWKNFSPLLNTPSTPFWKHWSMPYVFASALFLASLAWHQWGERSPYQRVSPPITEWSTTDTIFQRDTIFIVDTVYIFKKVYLNETQAYSSELGGISNSSRALPNNNTGNRLGDTPMNQQGNPASIGLGRADSIDSAHKSLKANDPQKISVETGQATDTDTTKLTAKDQNQRSSADRETITSGPDRRSMAAPSVVPQQKFVLKSDKEFTVGDTSNINQGPAQQKSKPMFHLELGGSMLFPISNLVEYYTPFQQTMQIGLEWESGWGVYLGVIRNQVEGELDDEEILSLSPSAVSQLPNVPSDINSLDEIYFINRQWFFPLELRWRSLYYSGFSFESSFGLMGNYLSKQEFTYEFENFSEVEYQFGNTSSGEFSLSHLKLGIGTNYLMSNRLGLFLRSHYWLPVARPGLLKDRMHGLEVGVGVNILFGK